MVSIVDVYDVITSDRCYHNGVSPSEGLKKILEWSGTHFEESLVHHFIKAVEIYPVGSLVKLKSGRLGLVIEQGEKSQLQPMVKVIYNAKYGYFIDVEVVDLAKPSCQDEIDCAVNPGDYGINCGDFI